MLRLVEDKRLALQRGSDRADELGERHIAAAQCRECRKGGMVAPSRNVPLDGRRALRRCADRDSNEAIAPPRYRLDVARLFWVVVERRTHLADSGLKHRVADELMAPYVVKQGVLREQRAGPPSERTEHPKRLWREGDSLSIAQQEGI